MTFKALCWSVVRSVDGPSLLSASLAISFSLLSLNEWLRSTLRLPAGLADMDDEDSNGCIDDATPRLIVCLCFAVVVSSMAGATQSWRLEDESNAIEDPGFTTSAVADVSLNSTDLSSEEMEFESDPRRVREPAHL